MRRLLALLLFLTLLLSGCSIVYVPPTEPSSSMPSVPVSSSQNLTVHFIDVGQADCMLLECGGQYMMIDGGNVADSSLVVSYLQKQGVGALNAVISTHPHEDHVGGLAGVLAVFPTAAVYAPTRTYSSSVYDNFLYYVDQQGLTVQIPKPGESFMLGDATITILGPLKSYEEVNNISIVLRVDYGDTRFLFTGDMETIAESDLLNSGTDVKADVLKVGHHGSYSSTSYRFLYHVDPDYGVISLGADNEYGHPHEAPMSRLYQADVTIFRTDTLGSIIAVSDGENITFTWEKVSAQPENTLPTEQDNTYIGNKKSKMFHTSLCANLPSAQNQAVLESYQAAIDAGYTPCSLCLS